MLWLVSSSRGIDPTRYSRVSETSAGVGPVGASAPHLCVDRVDRALDVDRIDAGADDERPFADARVERAVDVVRHALPLADVVGEPPAEAELPEHVVHHPVGVVARVEPPDRVEAVGDVRLRLAGHVDSATRRRRGAGGAGDRHVLGRRRATSLPAPPRRARSPRRIDVADDRRATRRRAGPTARGTRRGRRGRSRSTASIVPFGLPAVGMVGAVEQPGQRIDRAHRWVVVVLPQGGHGLRARLLDLALRETRDAARRRAGWPGRRRNPRTGRCRTRSADGAWL